jgi:hypothetical protein
MTHLELVARWPRTRALELQKVVGSIHVCGCGSPDAVWRVVLHLLERAEDHTAHGSFYDAKDTVVVGYGDPVGSAPALPWLEFGAKVLDAWKLTEHSSAIGGAWLTHQGTLLLAFLRDFGTSGDSSIYEEHAPDETYWPPWVEAFGWTMTGAEPGMWDAYGAWEKEESR